MILKIWLILAFAFTWVSALQIPQDEEATTRSSLIFVGVAMLLGALWPLLVPIGIVLKIWLWLTADKNEKNP